MSLHEQAFVRQGEAACPYCGVGCRLMVQARTGNLVGVRGSPDAAANRGRICLKGASLRQALSASDRAAVPLLREKRSLPFRQATWEEATWVVARRIAWTIEQHGPSAFGFYGSGRLDTEAIYAIVKLVKGGLTVNNTDCSSRLSMASATSGCHTSLGSDAPPACYGDVNEAHLILILASDMADSHPVIFEFVRAKKKIHPDTFIVVVDSRQNRTTEAADLHLQIRPGSDVAFLNALAWFLVSRGNLDYHFIRDHTTGYDGLASFLEGLNLVHLAELCGVEAGVLLTLADRIGCARRFLSFNGLGHSQGSAGVHESHGIINLHLLTGQIGKPGSGPLSLTIQANAMGSMDAGLYCHSLPGSRSVERESDRREVEAYWGLPPAAINARTGLTGPQMFRSLAEGVMKTIWICGANPLGSMPDPDAARQGLERADLVIVQDIIASTGLAAAAHVILPAARWAEKDGTTTNSERTVTFSERLIDPPGQALPDWKIFCAVGQAMGLPGFDFADAGALWDEFRQLTRGRPCDLSGMTAARLRKGRSLQWPCPHEEHPGTERLYTDHRFPTPDGRARILVCDNQDPPAEPVSGSH